MLLVWNDVQRLAPSLCVADCSDHFKVGDLHIVASEVRVESPSPRQLEQMRVLADTRNTEGRSLHQTLGRSAFRTLSNPVDEHASGSQLMLRARVIPSGSWAFSPTFRVRWPGPGDWGTSPTTAGKDSKHIWGGSAIVLTIVHRKWARVFLPVREHLDIETRS